MPDAIVQAALTEIADDIQFGSGVIIEADRVSIGAGCQIGVSGDDSFRTAAGVRIAVESLVLEDGVRIASAVSMRGGSIHLGRDVVIGRGTTINVADLLTIGAGGVVGEENDIAGRTIEIGQELWTGPRARIGGGSAFEKPSRLLAGHYLHLGLDAFVNTARPVTIGHEVGLGTRTSIYTHGAYSSRLEGFPVTFDGVSIGDFTWIPGAIINPGVRIGRNCVIGVNSLVTGDIPNGSLAAGSPAKVIREGAFPRPLVGEALLDFYESFLHAYASLSGIDGAIVRNGDTVRLAAANVVIQFGPSREPSSVADEGIRVIVMGDGWAERLQPTHWTAFDTRERRIVGAADDASTRLADELRRYGIRFYSRPAGQTYEAWAMTVPQHRGSGPHEAAASGTVVT